MGGIAVRRSWADAELTLPIDVARQTETVKISLDVKRIGLNGGKVWAYLRVAPTSCATAESVVCAAFSPRRKSLSEKVEYTSIG
jgi:hypothetical protein